MNDKKRMSRLHPKFDDLSSVEGWRRLWDRIERQIDDTEELTKDILAFFSVRQNARFANVRKADVAHTDNAALALVSALLDLVSKIEDATEQLEQRAKGN